RCLSRESFYMTAQTKLWVQRAEADFDVVLLLRRSRKRSCYDVIRFHCQQCAEKYLKARLQQTGERVPRTHNLSELLLLLLPHEPNWGRLETELSTLSRAAIDSRYPGPFCTSAEALDAFEICRRFR